MKNLFDLIVMILMASQLCLLIGWWGLALVALVSGLLQAWSGTKRYGLGILAGLLLFGGLSAWTQLANDGILTQRVAGIFKVDNGWLLVIVTGIFGAVIAGTSRYAGICLRELFGRKPDASMS